MSTSSPSAPRPGTLPGGSLDLADGLTLTRVGYGAMQLAGPGVWGPPRDHDEAVAVLREAVALGITHIDTSDYYGPYTVNAVIKEALHPYPEELHLVTKVGARRDPDKSWPPALSRAELTSAVHDNLDHLGLDALDVVNLRVGGIMEPVPGSLAEPFSVLAELREQGLIRHLGVSGVTPDQLTEAQSIAPVVCVQNFYNLAHRDDDDLVDRCAREGIAYTSFFPLGGFSPLQSGVLETVAARHGATPFQTALAWLLRRSPTTLLIPGTSSVAHLRENVAGAGLDLTEEDIKELDTIGG
ncbi:oxidoreductase [Streptomyces tsukubensis]|uniref:Oxidoreductase n=1 Tax=Streptomyces tsukubensis TaxID=83656 RepID=A0A1V4A934_9ACTN|nr:oxidoreductase [Streptomyces tsukubensis]OON78835.1 oxidoreductase [Streptomyces tsukubensis]QFR94311.1 oxidoreductase [Streptomyces tsukubensis]